MIGIIVVSYNSKKYLDDCLSSVFSSSYKTFRVYLVDNASTDGSAQYTRKHFPGAKVIETGGNKGFATGNNIGIREAIKDGCEQILLLNPDTVIDELCLETMARQKKRTTILQPLILIHENGEKTELINTTGNYLNYLGISYCGDYRENRKTATEKDVTSASGAAMFMDASVFENVGYLDDSFFMYHEDLDFCVRARLRGYNIRLLPQAVIWHKYHFSRNKKKVFFVERNRLLFLYKNFPFKFLLAIFPMMVLNEIFILLYSLLTGSIRYKLSSYLAAIKQFKDVRAGRKKNLVYFKNFDNVKKLIGAEINFTEIRSALFFPYNILLFFYWIVIKKLI